MIRGNLDAASLYAARAMSIFPVLRVNGKKVPATKHGYKDAVTDADQIKAWWTQHPTAMPAAPTGRITGMVVLDIDVKNGVSGWDALEELGATPLPATPHAHTPSGGTHVYFAAPPFEVRNSAGKIGRGLDFRGDGGSIILPAPCGGYAWDPHVNLDTTPLAPMPAWLIEATRPKPERIEAKAPDYLMPGLSRYGRAALDGAGRDIITAPAGAQESTLNGRAYWIGQLVGGGEIPHRFARDVLLYAAAQMANYDRHRPWRAKEIESKVSEAIATGMKRPAAPSGEYARA